MNQLTSANNPAQEITYFVSYEANGKTYSNSVTRTVNIVDSIALLYLSMEHNGKVQQ